jgi:soluble lytic murein transglycosylase-like protein
MKQLGALLIVLAPITWGQSMEALRWANYWADRYGVERELVHAVIEAESAWNPRAVSSAGAAGLMQLMPATAVVFRVANRFDVAENTRGGVAYLARLNELCAADRRLILASYNAGEHRVLRQGLHYRSREVYSYVTRVGHLYRRHRWETLLKSERRVDLEKQTN